MKSKKIPLDERGREIVEGQQTAFREKFGRDPAPNDPIFFDPDADAPRPYPRGEFKRQWIEMIDTAL